jgi:zinc protease
MRSERNKPGARFAIGFAALLIGTIAFSQVAWAQSSPQDTQSQSGGTALQQEPAFVQENLPLFKTITLSNGVKVYVKENKANRVRNLTLVLEGGSLVTKASEAGWANLALKTMERGSSAWPYEKASALLDETSSSISASSQFEYSTFSLNVLDKYFDELLPVWASMISEPSFASSDFDQAKSDTILAIQSKDQDPWALTQKITNEKYFAGHPYAVTPEGNEASVGAATVADMKAWYSSNVSADRIFVVAVGDFDVEKLKSELEATLGGIPDSRLGRVPTPPVFPIGPSERLFTEPDAQSRGLAYLRGDFAAPAPGAADYMAANMAMKMFSDLLFAIVRDKYGAVYTPSALIRGFEANYGSILIYKTSATDKIKTYIDEAASILASGKCVSIDPSRKGEEAKFMPVDEALATYKALYANEYFDAVRTNAAVAGLMIRSVVTTGTPYDWLYDVDRIASVNAAQVWKAFDEYITGGAFTWVAVGDPDLLAKLPEADFSK